MAWNVPLSEPLTLSDGRILRTLHDARDVLTSDVFAGVRKNVPLEHAIELLLHAAETGAGADIRAATDQLRIVLIQRGLMR